MDQCHRHQHKNIYYNFPYHHQEHVQDHNDHDNQWGSEKIPLSVAIPTKDTNFLGRDQTIAGLAPLAPPVGSPGFIYGCFVFLTFFCLYLCTCGCLFVCLSICISVSVVLCISVCHSQNNYEPLQASAPTLVSPRWTNCCSPVWKLFWINIATQSKLRHTAFRIGNLYFSSESF